MENIIAVPIDGKGINPHELIIVTEVKPDFLPPATLVLSDERRALLYTREDMTPLARYVENQGGISLGTVVLLLIGYIRCLLDARDMLLDARQLSSDSLQGVFVCKDARNGLKVKAIWGMDAISDEGEKICRIAGALAESNRVMGAKKSMERIIDAIRSQNPSLLNCLALAERTQREWNLIVRPV